MSGLHLCTWGYIMFFLYFFSKKKRKKMNLTLSLMTSSIAWSCNDQNDADAPAVTLEKVAK